MALPVTIPNSFANATSSIPLSQLDTNFNTLSNAVNGINSGAETLANLVATTANVTTGNITTVNATTVDTTNIEVTNIKAKDGTAAATIADSTGKITVSTELAVDNLNLSVNTISSTDTNGNIVLAPNGSGDVQVDADTLRVGDSGSDATVQSNGNADLILKTGNATTGSVTLADGADGNLTVALNGTGQIIVNAGAVGTPTIAPTGDTNTGIFFPAADTIAFAEGGAEAMRITSTGRVAINRTTTDYVLDVQGEDGQGIRFTDSTNSVQSFLGAYTSVGITGTLSNHPTTIWTNNAERARITSGGDLFLGATSSALNSSRFLSFTSANQSALTARSTNASQTDDVVLVRADRNTTNGSYSILSCYNDGANAYKFRVFDSGNVVNTNNSYGQISDIKTKQDIVDAASQWDDIKNIRVRKFRFKNDPTGFLQIGVVAQEAELVSPGLIDESTEFEQVEVTDEEGNVTTKRQATGETIKSVKYSVLYMKAVKALQEAMERIETLEAKVAALENA